MSDWNAPSEPAAQPLEPKPQTPELADVPAPAPSIAVVSPAFQPVAPGIGTGIVQAVAPSRVVGKTRNPWGVWLLGLTIIYPYIWYFKINKELRDFSETIDVQPGMAVVAITLGSVLIGIPPLVSWVHTSGRIQRAQKLAGSTKRCSALISIVTLTFGMVYIQSQLNKVWDQYGNPPLGTPIMG